MAQDKQVDTEKYKGPGKITSTLTGLLSGYLVGAIGSLVTKQSTMLGPKGAIGWAIVGISAVVGGVFGFTGAANAKKQFEAAKAERDEARGQLGQAAGIIQTLETEKGALNHEVGEHRRKFAEGLKSHAEHASHAEAVRPHGEHKEHAAHADQHHSRAEHGSHAAAAEADKAHAEKAAVAV